MTKIIVVFSRRQSHSVCYDRFKRAGCFDDVSGAVAKTVGVRNTEARFLISEDCIMNFLSYIHWLLSAIQKRQFGQLGPSALSSIVDDMTRAIPLFSISRKRKTIHPVLVNKNQRAKDGFYGGSVGN